MVQKGCFAVDAVNSLMVVLMLFLKIRFSCLCGRQNLMKKAIGEFVDRVRP